MKTEEDNYIVLGLDPALTTGWSVIENRQGKITILATGIIELTAYELGSRMLEYGIAIRELLQLWKPYFVVAEESNVFFNKTSVRLQGALRGKIAEETRRFMDVEANFIQATSARRLIGVGGGAKKKEVAQYLQVQGYEEEQPVDWCNRDITDALCIGIGFIREI